MKTILLLALFLVAVTAAPADPPRIVGGSTTNINRYPFAVVLLRNQGGNNFRQTCGGSIISPRAVLSAAHCFHASQPGQWRARVGSTNAHSGGVVHTISRLISHPRYNHNARNYDNDIAVLHVHNRFNYNNNVRVGRIAEPNNNPRDNEVVWAIGWGRIRHAGPLSEQLRHVQVWVINQNTCRSRYSRIRPVTDNMLCSGWLNVGGRDQCQGDSGGPLLHNNIIVGVCSWGQRCAEPNYPGVNARVSRYTSWIRSHAIS